MTFEEKIADLIKRGYTKEGTDRGDFVVMDDNDGRGPFLRWKHEDDCPYEDIRREYVKGQFSKEFIAARDANLAETEANEQERKDMVKAAEIVQAAIAQVDVVTKAATDAVRAANDERDAWKARAMAAEDNHKSLVSNIEAVDVKLDRV